MSPTAFYRFFLNSLSPLYDTREAEAISRIVFEDLGGISRADMLLQEHLPLPSEKEKILLHALEELQTGKPVQYVTGKAYFRGQVFRVNESVLIPRPETEELTEKAIRFLEPIAEPAVLDIGTGSGCIASSISLMRRDALVVAIDKNEQTIETARINAAQLGATVCNRQLDFLDETQWPGLDQYDLIISNPPYIPISEKESLEKNVRDFEPGMALFVPDADPLLFYKAIGHFAAKHLNKGGCVMLECHTDRTGEVAHWFTNQGWEAQSVQDLFGKPRFVLAVNRFRSP